MADLVAAVAFADVLRLGLQIERPPRLGRRQNGKCPLVERIHTGRNRRFFAPHLLLKPCQQRLAIVEPGGARVGRQAQLVNAVITLIRIADHDKRIVALTEQAAPLTGALVDLVEGEVRDLHEGGHLLWRPLKPRQH